MLTPIDIQNHVLKSTMGGYNKKETDDFIESIQESYEQLYKENHDLKEKVTALSEGLQYYKQMEGTLQKTLMLAEKTATETLEASRTKASKVEKESQQKAGVMLSSAKAKADAIVQETETKANTLLTESQEKADTLLRESKTKSETMLTESRAKAEAVVSEAQRKADHLLTNANERADRVISQTRESSESLLDKTKSSTEQMLHDANVQLNEVTSTVQKLIDCYHDYKEQFQTMLSRQLEQLEDPAFTIQVPDLQKTLESQQVAIAREQASLRSDFDAMEQKTKELDWPVEDTLPDQETSADNWDIGQTVQESTSVDQAAEDLLAELSAKASENMIHMEDAFQASSESVTAMPDTEAENGSQTEEEDSLDALARMAAAAEAMAPAEMETKVYNEDGTEREKDFADIALEALRRVNSEVIPKTPIASEESSVLGTSYDDFVPESQGADIKFAGEVPLESPSSVPEEPKVIPMPDFAKAMEEPASEQPSIPMPDFARAMEDPSTEEPYAEQPSVPMPDFAKVTEDSFHQEESQISPQVALQAEEYITGETYFGSADNIPYTGSVSDFSNGIGGVDNTQSASGTQAAGDLFTGDFSGVAASGDDEFAVGGDASSSGQEMPFTFINANDAN